MTTRRKYRWALLFIVLVIAGMWTGIGVAGLEPRLGLDLQGGISVVLNPKEGTRTDTLEQAVNIIRNRVDALGVAEPEIARQGENILVQLPGIKEQERALQLIGTTAQLRFRPVLEEIIPNTDLYDGVGPKDCDNPATYPEDVPGEEIVLCVRAETESGRELPGDQWSKLRLGPVALEGTDVSDAQAVIPGGQLGGVAWQVQLDLTGEGARKFADVTGKLACNPLGDATRQLAIVLDRIVESHPQMGEDVECDRGIPGGTAQITGNFSDREAKDLALVLRYGALPVELEPSSTTTVSPTLGRDSLRSGLLAGLIGLAIVFIYVVVFYRALGFVIWLGLAVHAAITLSVIIVLSETAGFALTLAGIAGLIVSIGIATDSFIVYFERLRDEVREGRSVRAAVERGWASARRTIVAADLVTALAALILYMLAVGGVRGFALMLGLSTALDLVVSYMFMHPLVWMMAQTRRFGEGRALGVTSPLPEPVGAAGGKR